MKTLSLSEAKTKWSGLVEEVAGHDEEIVITRTGRPAAILVSADEFDSWKETVTIRGDVALRSEVKAGLAALLVTGWKSSR